MTTVNDTNVCIACGEEYWYQFDCRTGIDTKISMCKCDRWAFCAEKFLDKHGLLGDFIKEFAKEERKHAREAELTGKT